MGYFIQGCHNSSLGEITGDLDLKGFNINNVQTISGTVVGEGDQAFARIDISNSSPVDGQLIVLTDGQGGGQGQVIVLNFKPNPVASNEFNLDPQSPKFLVNVINDWSGAVTAFYNEEEGTVYMTVDVPGVNGASFGSTLAGASYSDFSGGSNAPTLLQLGTTLNLQGNNIEDVNQINTGTLVANDGIELDGLQLGPTINTLTSLSLLRDNDTYNFHDAQLKINDNDVGATGEFDTDDGKRVVVKNGLIVNIYQL